jgi:hypothetical protein
LRRSIILVPLILLIAGCGDSKKPSPDEQVTRAAYAQQADAVCQKAEDALEALGQPDGLNDLPAYAKQAAAIVMQERDDLKALQAPPGDEDRVEELNETLDAVVRVAKGLENVAASRDPAAIDDFVKQNGAVDQKAKKLARDLGMQVCGASQ